MTKIESTNANQIRVPCCDLFTAVGMDATPLPGKLPAIVGKLPTIVGFVSAQPCLSKYDVTFRRRILYFNNLNMIYKCSWKYVF